MPYEPDWERLSRALKRAMAAGVAEVSAKRAICDAIADGKIAVRLYFLVPPINIDRFPRRELRYARDIRKEEIPLHLTPSDFDWTQSRVRKSGRWEKVRDPFGSFVGHWRVIEAARYHTAFPERHQAGHASLRHPAPRLERPQPTRGNRRMAYCHRIELFRADVTKVLCGSEDTEREPATVNQETRAIQGLASHLRTNPDIMRADAADWCERAGHKLGKRAFARIWPQARARAGLPPIAAPGRKPKSSRRNHPT